MFVSWVLLVATIIVLGFTALRWPRWAVVLVGISVALEIVSQVYPQPGGMDNGVLLLTPARLACVAVIMAAFFKFVQQIRQHNLPKARYAISLIVFTPLMAVILGFWLYGAAGLVYSADVRATSVELLRWGLLIAVLASASYLLEKEDIPLVFQAVHITGLLLAPLVFAEKLTGQLLWQSERLMVESTLRVNATFVDPNIFARYLVLAIVANLVLQRLCSSRRGLVMYWLGLAVLLAELVLTGSRGGIVTLAVVLLLALLCLPRRKELAVLIGGVTVGGVAALWLQPGLLQRFMNIEYLLTDTWSPRRYLIEAALAIFGDHVVFGTGLGTFATVFVEQYESIRTYAEGPVRSHTTVLTVAAEQGVIGLVFLAALFGVFLYMLIRLYANYSPYADVFYKPNAHYVLGVGCFLWVMTVFVSSQAEGRLFEDPMFWLAAAMLMVLNRSG